MKKIAIIAEYNGYIPRCGYGAIETLITNLAKENEIQKKCDLTIFSTYCREAYERSQQYTQTHFVYIRPGAIRKFIYKLQRAWNKSEAQGSYIYRELYFQCIADRLKAMERFDYVVLEQTGDFLAMDEIRKICPPGNLIYHSHLYECPAEKPKFAKVIAVSRYCAEPWSKYFTAEDIMVLPNGVDEHKFLEHKSDGDIVRKRLGVGKGDFLVIFVGRMLPVKGLRELLLAMKCIEDVTVKLLIIGDPYDKEYVDDIENLCQQVPDRVINLFYVDNDKIPEYLSAADVQVIPSIWEEPAALVCMEAMQMGLPLIVTRSGGMVEYVNEACAITVEKKYSMRYARDFDIEKIEDETIVAPIAKAIMFLKNNPERRKAMREASLRRGKMFTRQAYYEKFISLMENQ